MKNYITTILILYCVAGTSQVFYTENFTSGGVGWNLASVQGVEGADPNFFKVSAEEGGGITPNLGAPGSCGAANNGNNSMFVTSVFNPTGGAAYDAGGLCGFLFCPRTNRRAESPIINCSGKTGISISFNYIEGGQGTTDDATLWYFDGTTWAQIDNMPKTALGCGGQGLWISRTIVLPLSANNNTGVKIGFKWINNDDGAGSDPSLAVDDITLFTSVVTPAANFSANSTTICAGQCINFTDLTTNSPTSWSWVFPGAVVSTSTLQNPAGICYNTTGTYTVSLTAASGTGTNTNTKANYITVLGIPSITINPASAAICAGNTQTLIATGATNYSWTPAAGLTSTNTAATTFTANSGANYTVVGANGTCTSSATKSITVNPLPVVSVNPSSSSICAGSTQTLLASGANSYTWTPNASLTSFITAATTFTGSTSSSYTVIGTNGTCTASATTSITVNSLPSLTIAPNNPSICAGTTQTLLASGASSYTWSPSTGLTSVNTAATTFTSATGNSYTITGSNGSCTATTATTITVKPLPTLTITPNNPVICPGSAQILSASGATNYTWSPGSSLTSTNTAATTFTGSSTSTYTITGSAAGCNSTTTTTVTVSPTLSITVSPVSATVCAGTTQLFQASGATNYTWSPATNLSSATNSVTLFTAGASAIYTITGASGLCSGSTTLSVNVLTAPVIVSTTPSTSLCAGNTQSLSVTGATNYTWSPSNGLTSTNIATPNFTGNTSQIYTVTGSNGGCPGTTTVMVNVNPVPNINASPATVTLCAGSAVNLKATGGIIYTWNPSTALSSNTVSSPTCNTNSSINYTVTGTDANGCTANAQVSVTVMQAPVATFTYVTPGSTAPVTINFGNTSQLANSYLWQFSGGNPNVNTTVFSPTQTFSSGTYTVVLIASNNGCTDTTQTVISVIDNSFIIMPNVFTPNADGVNEVFKAKLAGIETLNCTIFDRWGLKMFSYSEPLGFWDGRTTAGEQCTDGVYFYVLEATSFDGKTFKLKGNVTLIK